MKPTNRNLITLHLECVNAKKESIILPQPKLSATIPRVIYQTWATKHLPSEMMAAVMALKAAHPRFRHELFDDNDCRNFIKNHFPCQVLNAFDRLIPGAYKADLWRYCILYLYGGVYLDIKFIPVNGFSLESLIGTEIFCLDVPSLPSQGNSVYNAFMIIRAGNEYMKQCILTICDNVRERYYGKSILEPTGPRLLGKFVPREVCHLHNGKDCIMLYGDKIFDMFASYRSLQSSSVHYSQLWKAGKIYT